MILNSNENIEQNDKICNDAKKHCRVIEVKRKVRFRDNTMRFVVVVVYVHGLSNKFNHFNIALSLAQLYKSNWQLLTTNKETQNKRSQENINDLQISPTTLNDQTEIMIRITINTQNQTKETRYIMIYWSHLFHWLRGDSWENMVYYHNFESIFQHDLRCEQIKDTQKIFFNKCIWINFFL